ncbi:MAG TPA: MbnP family protein, partial [Chryseolinea sp.]
MRASYSIFVLFLFLALTACEDDDDVFGGTGQLTLEFDNRVGEENLELHADYVSTNDETFQLSKLNYYVSNIRLKTTDGKEFIVPQDSSYFLIMEDHEASQRVTLKNIPSGDYNEISFTIGV